MDAIELRFDLEITEVLRFTVGADGVALSGELGSATRLPSCSGRASRSHGWATRRPLPS
jgi:hypothetical protein